jgi:hypothetical protein
MVDLSIWSLGSQLFVSWAARALPMIGVWETKVSAASVAMTIKPDFFMGAPIN